MEKIILTLAVCQQITGRLLKWSKICNLRILSGKKILFILYAGQTK